MLLLPRANPIRQEEDRIATAVERQRIVAPEDSSAVDREEPGDRFQQGRLAGSVWTDQADDLIAVYIE